jgi:hypothetical protein
MTTQNPKKYWAIVVLNVNNIPDTESSTIPDAVSYHDNTLHDLTTNMNISSVYYLFYYYYVLPKEGLLHQPVARESATSPIIMCHAISLPMESYKLDNYILDSSRLYLLGEVRESHLMKASMLV